MDMDMDMDIDDWELLQVPNDNHTTAFEFGLESGKDLLLSKEANFGPAAFVDHRYFVLPSENQELVDHHYCSPPELGTRENISSGDDEDEKYNSLSRRSRTDEEEEEDGCVDHDAEEKPCRRWRLVGGVGIAAAAAAATICLLALRVGRRQPNYKTHSQSQSLPFQIYADEKRIKRVVQQATRLNHALTAARGAVATTTVAVAARANISFGGYYDGL